ncbi:MAG: RHS repeat-associated core domain-containing protein [Ottowia sp.]|uniref:RHS repeat domain-containing protein n=1 Tax=Ottowia sp. TaxID=1898956 RepID=UPI0039E3BD52
MDTSVSYTPQGHTKQKTGAQGTKDYSYSAAERLIKYSNTPQGQSTASLEASYRYDPLGRRIAKSVKEGATTATTYFVYGDNGLMGEVNDQGQVTKAYGFNPNAAQQGLWSTDPVWQANVSNGSLTDAGTSYHYLHTDHLGTPMLATDKSGATSWKAVSEAFGAAGTLPESRITMNLRFPGQYFDSETGSHHNYRRDFMPHAGRYLEIDPIDLRGGVNWFIYADANALKFSDDDGLEVNWSGRISNIGLATGFGVQVSLFTLESECKCDKKYKISGFATFATIGLGASLPLNGVLKHASGSTAQATLTDRWRDCPAPSAANGSAWVSGVNAVTASFLSVTQLGRLKSYSFADKSLTTEIGFTSTLYGHSAVLSIEETTCCSK